MPAPRTTEEDPLGWLREEFRRVNDRLEEIRAQSSDNGTACARLEEQQKSLTALFNERTSGASAACAARHESNRKKIENVHRILTVVGLGVVGTAAATLWNRVFPK
jgi:ferric-dicitrate binding protein FerR (iron transport regulator)